MVPADNSTACVDDYFQDPNMKELSKSSEGASLEDSYEELFHLDVAEESLATFASWEPRHSRFCYPWKQYVHLGVVLRHLAYTAFALHGCTDSHIQVPQSVRVLFKEPCKHLADEIVKVLSELAEAIKTHHQFSARISDHLHEALQELDTSIKVQPLLFLASNPSQKVEALKEYLQGQTKKNDQIKQVGEKMVSRTMSKTVISYLEFSEALPLAAFVSLLIEAVARLDHVIEEVEELGKIAHFEEFREGEVIKSSMAKDSGDAKKISRNLRHEENKDIISRNLQFLLSNLGWCDGTHFTLPVIKRVI